MIWIDRIYPILKVDIYEQSLIVFQNELDEKWFNQYTARIRITVERAIVGVKRCRFVKDKYSTFASILEIKLF